MLRFSIIATTIALSVFVCSLPAQEPTIAPELAPPMLPAPTTSPAPEYLPPTSSLPSYESYTAPPPAISYEHPPVRPVALYDRVRVRDAHKSHPYGVPTVITVVDPRNHHCTVNVEVCMPPCACKQVTRNLRGNRVRYDFGDYEILVISRLGRVIIDYDA